MSFELEINKENFKFAASHFALFGPSYGERMHGHNYNLSLRLTTSQLDPKLGISVEFNELKPAIVDACKQLDEYILIPENSPYLNIQKGETEIKVEFAKKTYVFPREDVLLLPLLNISCEELSRYLWQQLKPTIKKFENIESMSIQIQETPGQSARFTQNLHN